MSDNKETKQAPAVEAACETCKGLGWVDDGEIWGSGGVEYTCGPVKCVKDCPKCGGTGKAVEAGARDADLRTALEWTAGTLQTIVQGRWRDVKEQDRVSIGNAVKTISDVLDMADAALARASEAAAGEPVDYDRVVQICEAYGIGLPVDCVEMVVEIIRLAAPQPASEQQAEPIAALVAEHAKLLDQNDYAYFELAYTRQTGWMAWLTDRPARGEPGTAEYAKSRKVIARGQGDTAQEACQDALNILAAKGDCQ